MANQNKTSNTSRQDTGNRTDKVGSTKQASGNQMDQQGRSQSGMGRNQQDLDQDRNRSHLGNRGSSDRSDR